MDCGTKAGPGPSATGGGRSAVDAGGARFCGAAKDGRGGGTRAGVCAGRSGDAPRDINQPVKTTSNSAATAALFHSRPLFPAPATEANDFNDPACAPVLSGTTCGLGTAAGMGAGTGVDATDAAFTSCPHLPHNLAVSARVSGQW